MAAANKNSYDVAVLDYTLPETTGLDLMDKLKRLVADLEVILLSGRSEQVLEEEAADRGAYAYFCKPCRLSELEQAIEEASRGKPSMSWEPAATVADTDRR
jgi:two-component system response regulator HydG